VCASYFPGTLTFYCIDFLRPSLIMLYHYGAFSPLARPAYRSGALFAVDYFPHHTTVAHLSPFHQVCRYVSPLQRFVVVSNELSLFTGCDGEVHI